jgi:hypothetical protein
VNTRQFSLSGSGIYARETGVELLLPAFMIQTKREKGLEEKYYEPTVLKQKKTSKGG